MSEKYYAIFEVKDWFPILTTKKYTKTELQNIIEKSKVNVYIEELNFGEDYYLLSGYTYCNNRQIARELWKEKVYEWWETVKDK